MSKRGWRKAELLALVTLFVFAVGVRCFFSAGVVFDESILLAKQAWQIAYASKAVEIFRWLLAPPFADKPIVIVTALAYRVFGVNDFSSFLPTLLVSLALIGFTAALTNRWFGGPAALVASFLLALFPLEIFLATNLFSATMLLSIKIASLSLFFGVNRGKANRLLGWATILAALGLLVDWTIFLPIVVLELLIHFVGSKNYFLWMGGIAGVGFVVLALLPGGIAAALDLYDSALLPIENLIYLPLLFFALVYSSKAVTNERVRTVLLWIGLEAIFLFVAGSKIVSSDIFASIGIGAYWVQILIPVIILLGWAFVDRVGDLVALNAVTLASLLSLLLLLTLVLDGQSADRTFDIVTRISMGLAFLAMWLFVFLLNSKTWFRSAAIMGFFATFALGSLMATKTYSHSYAYLAVSSAEALNYIEEVAPDARLLVAGQPLFDRLSYLNYFAAEDEGVRLVFLDQTQGVTAARGEFVLVEENFQEFVLGLKPDNWRLVAEFGQPDYRRLFLYQVQ